MKQYNVGLIGAGYMARLHSLSMKNFSGLFPDYDTRFSLHSIVDVDLPKAQFEAKLWGYTNTASDWREIVSRPDIDVIVVATTNCTHEDICEAAFKAGKDVLCEKPLSSTREGAARMAAVALRSERINFVNFTYRAWPLIQQARDLIKSGRIGRILHFDGHFYQDHNSDPTIPCHWRFKRSEAGAGALGDIGSHIIDLARFLAGEIHSVASIERRWIPQRPRPGDLSSTDAVDVDDQFSMLVEFANGASGTIQAGWTQTGYKNEVFFSLVGEKGSIRFNWQNSNNLEFFDADDDATISGFRVVPLGRAHKGAEAFWFPDLGGKRGVGVTGQGLGYGDAFQLSYKAFADALNGNSTDYPSFVDGLRSSEIIGTAQLASSSRAWQAVHSTNIAGVV